MSRSRFFFAAVAQLTERSSIHKLVLDALGVQQVAAVIGGSMGGFSTLEWPLCTEPNYVKTIVPITTSAYHSAWGISWGEAQRQCIYADREYQDGWYEPLPSGQPAKGLGAARMIGMLTYRSHVSFDKRFGRKPAAVRPQKPSGLPTPSPSDAGSCASANVVPSRRSSRKRPKRGPRPDYTRAVAESTVKPVASKYAAQSYMQYQADKFLQRFDANCYVHLTSKMDTHDVSRDRSASTDLPHDADGRKASLRASLSSIPAGALVISVNTDVLFRPELQVELAEVLPEAMFASLESPDGHDGFLLEFEALGKLITKHLRKCCPEFYDRMIDESDESVAVEDVVSSVFGEQEPEF